jgi:hypothetical protein
LWVEKGGFFPVAWFFVLECSLFFPFFFKHQQAAQLISKSLLENGQGLIELRKIDAAKEIAATLAKSRNVAYLPGGKNLLLNMAI